MTSIDSISGDIESGSTASPEQKISSALEISGNSTSESVIIEEPYPFVQTKPQNGGIVTSTVATLEWTASRSADHYLVTIARDSAFKQVAGEIRSVMNTCNINIRLENNVNYYWKVKAVNQSGTSNSLNDTMSFYTLFNLNDQLDDYLKGHNIVIKKLPVSSGDLYSPLNTTTWDYWFAKQGDVYHAFHLERPNEERSDYIAVGHAVSNDLKHWVYYGTIVQAETGSWDDLRIATGSTVLKDGIWYTFYTGHSTTGSGVGLSVSKDMYRWMKVGQSAIIPASRRFAAEWKEQEAEVSVGADPYVYPEPVNGWFYMIANATILDQGLENPGAIFMLKSQDLLNWEGHKIIAHTGTFTRMETPQIWNRNGLWYLYFGGVQQKKNVDISKIDPAAVFHNGDTEVLSNYIYTSTRIDGEYSAKSWSNIKLPDSKPFYICKILGNPAKQDVLLTTYWGIWKLSQPYNVKYNADGSLSLSISD
ncbi:MAG: glycoside hydrolase family protein [Saccharofermentanales bacterium]